MRCLRSWRMAPTATATSMPSIRCCTACRAAIRTGAGRFRSLRSGAKRVDELYRDEEADPCGYPQHRALRHVQRPLDPRLSATYLAGETLKEGLWRVNASIMPAGGGHQPQHINAHGKPQSIAAVTKQRLLDAMHRSTAATKVAVNCRAERENFHSRQNVAAGGRTR